MWVLLVLDLCRTCSLECSCSRDSGEIIMACYAKQCNTVIQPESKWDRLIEMSKQFLKFLHYLYSLYINHDHVMTLTHFKTRSM